jgi:hypothetical protein
MIFFYILGFLFMPGELVVIVAIGAPLYILVSALVACGLFLAGSKVSKEWRAYWRKSDLDKGLIYNIAVLCALGAALVFVVVLDFFFSDPYTA